MKILLLGDFSALHKNLKEGLVALGHDVTIASNGDGWKKVDTDINLYYPRKNFLDHMKYRFFLLKQLLSIKGYDVVQLVNPFIFPARGFPRQLVIN
ncbi:hypothetical protein QE250_16965, partial [Chromatiaceae bacterium AAb-1]|nr:hypothetical protein [Chromatiaceae bacterium AAb-1]